MVLPRPTESLWETVLGPGRATRAPCLLWAEHNLQSGLNEDIPQGCWLSPQEPQEAFWQDVQTGEG